MMWFLMIAAGTSMLLLCVALLWPQTARELNGVWALLFSKVFGVKTLTNFEAKRDRLEIWAGRVVALRRYRMMYLMPPETATYDQMLRATVERSRMIERERSSDRNDIMERLRSAVTAESSS